MSVFPVYGVTRNQSTSIHPRFTAGSACGSTHTKPMIPQDNATGNFVKVEQRIPVRISLKGNKPEDLKRLRAGFNVECEVKY